MPRWLLVWALAATGVQGAQTHNAVGFIDDCVRRLDRGLDVGYQRIAARCPDLTPILTQSPWAPWLPRDWKDPANLLSADGLAELRTLLARTAELPSSPHTPQVGEVASVLARVTAADSQSGGWWSRFKRWLRQVATPRPRAQDDDTWLRRLFGDLQVSQALLRIIAWSALAGVVALALAVVMNELRVAGVLRPRQRAPGGAPTVPAGRAVSGLTDFERAPASEQPQLLLELITLRLAERQLLPPARALTLRELTRAALLPAEADRARLRELTVTCERLRFSERPPAAGTVAAAAHQGLELLRSLDGAHPQPQGAG